MILLSVVSLRAVHSDENESYNVLQLVEAKVNRSTRPYLLWHTTTSRFRDGFVFFVFYGIAVDRHLSKPPPPTLWSGFFIPIHGKPVKVELSHDPSTNATTRVLEAV